MEDNLQNIETGIEKKSLELNEEALSELTQIRKWTMFFAILGFIFIALMVFAGLIVAALSSSFGSVGFGKIPMALLGIIYLVFGIIYFFPILYLYKFSINSKKAIDSKDSTLVASALKSLKQHYRFVGALTIILFSIYILAIIGFAIGRMIG